MDARDCTTTVADGDRPEGARSAAEQRAHEWKLTALQRLVVAAVPETDLWLARVRGHKSLSATGRSETYAVLKLEDALMTYAMQCLMSGRPLPVFERPQITVSADTVAVVRVSTLRKQLLERSRQWGCTRTKLPPQAIELVLADMEALINRHAASLANPA
jgi:hypothetical protein